MRKPFTTREQAAFCATKTLRQIASETGRDADCLRRHAKIHGLPFRQTFRHSTPEIRQRVSELRLQGVSPSRAAAEIGFSPKWVREVYRAERNKWRGIG